MKTALHTAILLLASTFACADQAYIWVDSEGTTHFSESPPMDTAANAKRIELQPAPVTPALPTNRVETMNEQASRMQSSRRLREQLRDARRTEENKRQQERAETRAAAIEQQDRYSYGDYPHYPHHPHDHHGHDPDHNSLPPPLPRFVPGRTVTQKRNQENLRQHQEHRLQ